MKAVFKKTLVTAFAAFTAISLFAVSASAATPKRYNFTDYTGSETVSVDLNGDYTKFAGLKDKNGEIDSKNYTVSGDENKTTVTLKEDYLNGLENGEYNFNGYFENVLNTYEFTAFANVGVSIPASENSEFVNLTVGETEVDNANYEVEKTSGGFVITVDSEYLQTLPENTSFFCTLLRQQCVQYQFAGSKTGYKTFYRFRGNKQHINNRQRYIVSFSENRSEQLCTANNFRYAVIGRGFCIRNFKR